MPLTLSLPDAMADAGISASDLARATSANRSTVGRWCRRESDPSASNLDAICIALLLDDVHASSLRRWFAQAAS